LKNAEKLTTPIHVRFLPSLINSCRIEVVGIFESRPTRAADVLVGRAGVPVPPDDLRIGQMNQILIDCGQFFIIHFPNLGSGFTWRKRWARLSGGHGPKSVLLSLCPLKTSSAAKILVITDRVDREFDFLGSHGDVLSAVHLHPEERPSAASRSIRPLKPLGRCQPTFGACTLAGSPLLRRRAPDRYGRGVDYSIALVKRLSAFFIMLIGFEWVRPRLTPET
jgi:hypothetical protein